MTVPDLYQPALRKLQPFQDKVKTTMLDVQVQVSAMSIRYKIAAALLGVLVLAIAMLGIVSFAEQKKVLEREMVRRAAVLAGQVAAAGKDGLLTKEDLGVFGTIKEVQKSPDVVYAMVLDNKGKVFAHNILREKGRTPSEPEDKAALEASDLLVQHLAYGKESLIEASIPITAKLGSKTLRVGTARVGLSTRELEESIRRQKLSYAGVTVIFVLFGLGISYALGQVLSQRIVVLATGMKVVSEGDFSQLVEVTWKDEIGNLAEAFNDMILKLREKLHMERYLSQSTLQLIKRLRDTDKLTLGGEHRHVAVLFSDIRGFTSMSESMDADEVVGLLNVYLNLQAEVVYSMGGTLSKFVGDEVMSVFTEGDAELQAARAAVEIQRLARSLNAERASAGKRVVHLGIGLNCGDVIMGNMGSERQMEYTVIGDPINAAARLCSAAAPGQIIMSQAVAKRLGSQASVRALDPLMVKGKKEPMQVSELLAVPGAQRAHMRRKVALEATFALSGLEDERQTTRVIDLGVGGCLLEANSPLGVGSKLDLTLSSSPLEKLPSVACTVKHLHRVGGRYRVGLAFDELPEETRHQLSDWVHRVETKTPTATITEAAPAPDGAPAPSVN